METKKCTKCGEIYPRNSGYFYRNRSNKTDGLRPDCKKCTNKITKKNSKLYYKKNREKVLQKTKEYRQKNWERISQRNKDYRKKMKEQSLIDYNTLHDFIRRIKKRPKYCMICYKPKKLQLSSIDHKYIKDPTDWFYLCYKCHILFDQCRKLLLKYYEVKEWIENIPFRLKLF